ncbi:MAG: 4-(cytidine 5'-diphospho)-2-C-methyl-D-erythritol kinase [Candidatus Korobacteraceae bacterium]
MPTSIPSFAKINLGLKIGPVRADSFHELRTIYQTIALHDNIKVELQRGAGVEIRCKDSRIPTDESNTCYRVADRVTRALRGRGKVVIWIEKQLPVQGGLGAASSNAVATIFALERELGTPLAAEERLRIAAEVGSDLPLFLIGGTVLGIDRGQEVYPLQDLPPMHLVVITPSLGVSTPQAFANWDALVAREAELTHAGAAGTIKQFGSVVYTWLSKGFLSTGVPAMGGDRAETQLLDLVRAGIENDFERVVFPEHPELREAKRVLEREGAQYASLSGSGSTLYGIFASAEDASGAAERINAAGYTAVATQTLGREAYWKELGLA